MLIFFQFYLWFLCKGNSKVYYSPKDCLTNSILQLLKTAHPNISAKNQTLRSTYRGLFHQYLGQDSYLKNSHKPMPPFDCPQKKFAPMALSRGNNRDPDDPLPSLSNNK